jgi:hypothetical protein
MHPGNPLSLRQLAVLVAALYLVASAVLVLKCGCASSFPFAKNDPGSLPLASAAIGASTAVSIAWRAKGDAALA